MCWFVLFPLAASWPLVLNLGTHIPGAGAGDNVAFLWNFWWFRQALSDPGLEFFFTPYLFAPAGAPLVLHTHTALPALAGATILGSLSVAAAHNLVLLGGLAANGITTYLLAWHHVRRSMPAVLAGTVFAGSAYIWIHMLGHFNLVHAWVLPLVAWTWIRLLESPAISRGAAAGVAFAAAAYTDYYYLVFSTVFAAAWAVSSWWRFDVRWSTARWPRTERALVIVMIAAGLLIVAILITGGFRVDFGWLQISASRVRNPVSALWLLALAWMLLRLRVGVARTDARPLRACAPALAATFAVTSILALPLAVAAIQLLASGDYVSPPHTWRSGPRGIDLMTIVLGNPLHGHLARDVYGRFGIDLMEQAAWPGLIPLLLALILVRRMGLEADGRRWMWLAAFFFVWSCGAYLTIAGLDTGLPIPQALARFVPILSNARMPGRAFVMVQLAAAVVSAIVVTRARWRPPVVAALIAVAVLDSAVSIPLYRLPKSGALEARLRDAGRHAVVELPVGIRDGFGEMGRFDHRALVFQTAHRQPIAGGFVARLSGRTRQTYESNTALRSLLQMSGSPHEAKLPPDTGANLLALGITHLVVNTDLMPPSTRVSLEASGFNLVMVEGTRELYLIGKAP